MKLTLELDLFSEGISEQEVKEAVNAAMENGNPLTVILGENGEVISIESWEVK